MIVILLPCIMMPLKKNSIKKKNCPDFSFSLGTEIQSVNCWCLSLLHRLTLIIQKERCIFWTVYPSLSTNVPCQIT